MDPAILQQIPDEYKHIYRRNWKTIRRSVKNDILKDVYHYPLFSTNNFEIISRLREVLINYRRKIKINVALAFILRDRITDELQFFRPSNNAMLFDIPGLLINGTANHKQLEEIIERETVLEFVRLQRPSTGWTVERIVCVRFDILKLNV